MSPEITRRVGEGLERWIGESGMQPWVGTAYGMSSVSVDSVPEFVCGAAAHSMFGKIILGFAGDGSAGFKATLRGLGELVAQQYVMGSGWRELLRFHIYALLLSPEDADVGLIKNTPPNEGSWRALGFVPEHVPVRDISDYECSRHLWDEFVIDAAGLSLLTSKHLSHARDLSRWDVEEVAPDRFLVSAHDLEAWFAHQAPEPEVVEAARHDFGDMILSREAILSRPGPYTTLRPIGRESAPWP